MFKFLKRSFALVTVAILLFSNSASYAQSSEKIVFVSNRDGTDQIYIMDPDGSNVKRLTSNTFPEGYPTWSPNGTRLLFEGYHNGVGIYVMNSDGTNQRRLSPSPGYDVRPSWSHDGSKIVFSRVIRMSSQPFPTSIMTIDLATGKISTLLRSRGDFNIEPRWSPDGSKIVFMSNREGGQHIFTMRSDGGNVTRITYEGANGDPFWSPDGSRISFGSNREGGGRLNVFTMNSDGSDVRQVTFYQPPDESGDTSWSPDGSQIVYQYDIDGKGQSDPNVYAEVRVVNADGTNKIITGQTCSSVGCAPRWRPN